MFKFLCQLLLNVLTDVLVNDPNRSRFFPVIVLEFGKIAEYGTCRVTFADEIFLHLERKVAFAAKIITTD